MIYAAVVIYQKKCSNSVTMQCLNNLNASEMVKVIVYDNSEEDYGNREYCEKRGYTYFTECINMGLSFAYNRIIESLELTHDNYLLVLDDDTEITDGFFDEILNCNSADLYLPIVRSTRDNSIFSPCIIKNGVKSIPIESIDELKGQTISAINSGMLIRLSVYRTIKYNENLFMDYVDHDFMTEVNRLGLSLEVLNVSIKQNISREKIVNSNGVRVRFAIYGRDFKAFCFKRKKRMYYYCSFFLTAIRYCIQTMSMDFLFIYIDCIMKNNRQIKTPQEKYIEGINISRDVKWW